MNWQSHLTESEQEIILDIFNDEALMGVFNQDGRIISVNDKFATVTQFSPDELVGRDFFGDNWREMAGYDVWRGDLKCQSKNGDDYWVDVTVAPVKVLAADRRYLVVQYLVTDRKKAIESLSQITADLQKFKLAVEKASDHIIITDQDGVIIFANDSVERITGYKKEEVVGKKAGSKDLWGGQMPPEFYQKMWHIIKDEKKPFVGEIKNRRKDGRLYIALTSISPITDDLGEVKFFIGIERDISREKAVDKAKTEFVSLASHQLKTPLSAINWYSEMLIDGDAGVLSVEQQDFVQEIYLGSQRMVALVNALLNVSRIEMGTFVVNPTKVDLSLLINEELKELEPAILKKKHDVKINVEPNLPTIMADENLTRMVVQNLLSNAIKYTPEKGTITVSCSLKRGGELVNEQKTNADSLLLKVTDNGYGIPAHQKDKIFSKLFRADNISDKEVEGTGLGLYLVKNIVHLSQGSIWFNSEENKGTEFNVLLPILGMKKKVGSKQIANLKK